MIDHGFEPNAGAAIGEEPRRAAADRPRVRVHPGQIGPDVDHRRGPQGGDQTREQLETAKAKIGSLETEVASQKAVCDGFRSELAQVKKKKKQHS